MDYLAIDLIASSALGRMRLLCVLCLAALLCVSAEEESGSSGGGGGSSGSGGGGGGGGGSSSSGDGGGGQRSQDDELADGRYGSRREGMYKWQRNKDKVKDKALEAKARRLGISVEEVRELDEQRVLAEDPRKDGGSKIESDYGKRSGQYAWQRDKEEVKRKAEEAKVRAAGGGARDAGEHAADESRDEAAAAAAADLTGAVSVPVLLLKFDEPRSWYQKPRLCPPDTANNADCEKPTVGMRVRALEPSDLKEKRRLRLQEEDPDSYAWMEEMKGLGGAIVKLTNGKNNALVKFDRPQDEQGDGAEEGQEGQGGRQRYEVRRKVKLTERISPFSKKQGQLAKGDVSESLALRVRLPCTVADLLLDLWSPVSCRVVSYPVVCGVLFCVSVSAGGRVDRAVDLITTSIRSLRCWRQLTTTERSE
jgi:hypothetical protein